ncbi:MAG: PAS domain S-box protein [Woeseiaceae bacterium]
MCAFVSMWWALHRFETQGDHGYLAAVWLPMLALSTVCGLVFYALLPRDKRLLRDSDVLDEHVDNKAQFLASVVDNLPALVFVKEAESLEYVTTNKPFEKFFGVSTDDIRGKTDLDFFSEDLVAPLIEQDRLTLSMTEPLDVGMRTMTGASGTVRDLHTRKIAIRDVDGIPRYLLGVSIDVTEQQMMRRSLESSEQRYHQIIASASLGILTVDGDGTIVSANPSAEEILIEGSAPLVGQSYLNMLYENDRDASMKRLVAMQEAPDGRDLSRVREFVAQRFNGEPFPCWRSVARVDIGNEFMLAIMFRDLTEQKAAERALIEAREAAEEANRAKSEFLATMSHELRTPLNAILGFGELMSEDAEAAGDNTTVSYLQYIKDGGNQLLALVNDVLDLAKIEAGKVELNLEPTDVIALAEATARTLRGLVEQGGNEFVVALDDLPMQIDTDAVRLQQIMTNLLSNAAKFTENGRVTLSLEALAGDVPKLAIRVTDTGIGIPKEKLAHVMTAFGQADATTTRKYGGTGLGLTITSRNCELLGGQLAVTSRFGEWSEFTATVDLSPSAMDTEVA